MKTKNDLFKVAITKKQAEDFNNLLASLKTISREYMTLEELQRKAVKMYGCSYHEALEMAYENIKQLAKQAIRGVKPIKTEDLINGD